MAYVTRVGIGYDVHRLAFLLAEMVSEELAERRKAAA